MATEKSFQLYIKKDNVKHYFTASGGVLNGAQISTKYITMRTSSTTATFTMNDAGRDVLFPSAAAIAHKIDVWAQAIATLNNSKNTINVAIAGQNAITTERIHTSLNEYTGSVSGSFTKSNTSAIYVIKIANGFHAAGVRDTSITAYFTQYFCAANKAGKGVKNISVSNAAPYEGETVTFSAELYNGANFEGWYSDEACTQLVSSNLTYSTTAADITLYAKATIDANLYNVSAVAGAEITSASVSDSIVPEGDTATFTAQVNTGCSFEAWYSDDTYTTVVSTENPYTATITANTTLYAKAHRNSFNMSVGSAEHGTASVSATTVPYGDIATFTFTPEDETWELYGWYSDSALTQLVSEANPYRFRATKDVTLYPKVGKKRYTITFKTAVPANTIDIKVAVLDFDALTRTERSYLKVGNYEAIEQNKVFDIKSASINSVVAKNLTVEILCPLGMTAAFWGTDTNPLNNTSICFIDDVNSHAITSWPYYWYQPSEDATFKLDELGAPCDCSAIAKEGISYADVTTPTRQGYNAIFEAEVASGYVFSGWYSDEACTTLVSTDNPAHVTTPSFTGTVSRTSLTLYAKATKAIYTIGVGTTEHGSATVSATAAYYGDTVTFNCTVDEGYEFKGWYSDEGLTQLVSESVEYVHSVTGDVTLYPKVVPIKSSLLLHPTGYDEINILEGTEIEGIERIYINDESADGNDSAKITIPHSKIDNPISLGFYIDGSKFTNIPNNAIITDITISSTLNYNTLLDKSYITEFCTAKRTYTNGTVSYTRIGENKYKNTKVSTEKTYSLTKNSIGSWSPEELKNGQFGIIFSAYSSNTNSTYDKIIIHNINILIAYTMPENEQVFYTVNAVPMDHCTTTVNATIAQYGDNVIFKCVVDKGYEFKGWYSNEELTQFVNKDAEYIHNITGNVILWPKIEIANNNFIIHPTGYNAINFKLSTEIQNIECLYENDSNSSTDCCAEWIIDGEQDGNTSTNPASLAFYVAGEKFINIPDNAQIIDLNVLIRMGGTLAANTGALAKLHEIYTAQRSIENGETIYNQIGIKKYTDKSNIPKTKINSYTLTNAEVGNWTPAALKAGKFSIVLSASFNRQALFTRALPEIYNIDIFVSYALPATGFSFKTNGTWKNALAVFKKTNGAWVQQSDPASLFTGSPSGTESNYLYLGE